MEGEKNTHTGIGKNMYMEENTNKNKKIGMKWTFRKRCVLFGSSYYIHRLHYRPPIKLNKKNSNSLPKQQISKSISSWESKPRIQEKVNEKSNVDRTEKQIRQIGYRKRQGSRKVTYQIRKHRKEIAIADRREAVVHVDDEDHGGWL